MKPGGLKPGAPKTGKDSVQICEICDGYIRDLEQLRNHMQFIHKVKIHPKMIHNRPPLNCQKCQYRFFTDQVNYFYPIFSLIFSPNIFLIFPPIFVSIDSQFSPIFILFYFFLIFFVEFSPLIFSNFFLIFPPIFSQTFSRIFPRNFPRIFFFFFLNVF